MFTVEVVAFKSIRVLKAVPLNMMTSSTLAAHQHTPRRAGYQHQRGLTKDGVCDYPIKVPLEQNYGGC